MNLKLGAIFILITSLLYSCESRFRESQASATTSESSSESSSSEWCPGGVCSGALTFSGATTFSSTATFSSTVNINSTFNCVDCISSTHITNASIVDADISNNTITAGKLSPGTENDILTTNSLGAVAWYKQHHSYGVIFTRPTASTVQLNLSGIDGKAMVLVSSGTDLIAVNLTATLTADLTASGAGGLDAGAEAASTGYDVYLITQAAGASPALLLTVSGAAPTLPVGYTHKSEVVAFVVI